MQLKKLWTQSGYNQLITQKLHTKPIV